jgi:large subunit ribosomal protein L4
MQTALRSQMAFRPATASRPARLVVANSAVAAPATLPYKAVDGSSKGSAELALKVAEDSAKGLVHRYVVLVQQNARRVRQGLRSRQQEAGAGWAACRLWSGGTLQLDRRSPLPWHSAGISCP